MVESSGKKIVVVGDENCGKTSFLNRIRQRDFSNVYVPTIFEVYEIELELGLERYDLLFHDIAGSDDLARLRPLAYYEADVILFCFNVDSTISLKNCVDKWFKEVNQYCPKVPYFLVGCKKDLRPFTYTEQQRDIVPELVGKNSVSHDEGLEIAKRLNCRGYFECSAKLNEGISELLEAVVRNSSKGFLNNGTSTNDEFHQKKEILFCGQCKMPVHLKAVCQECFERENRKLQHGRTSSSVDEGDKFFQLYDKIEEISKKVSDLETRIDSIGERMSVKVHSIENYLTDLAKGYRLASTLKEMSEKVVSIEHCLDYLDNQTEIVTTTNSRATTDVATRMLRKIDDVPTMDNEKSPIFRTKTVTLSNEMMKKILDTQSRLCTVICKNLEEGIHDDLRVVKMIASKLRLNPNDILNCTRLGLPSPDYVRDVKVRFISPDAATKFLTTPKDAIRSDRKFKHVRFTNNCSEEQEREARELWLELKSLNRNGDSLSPIMSHPMTI